MPRSVPLLPHSEVAGQKVYCARNGFPHYSVLGASMYTLFPSLDSDGQWSQPVVLKLRGGKRFEFLVLESAILPPQFEERFRFKGIAFLANDAGERVAVRDVEVNYFTNDEGRRTCLVEFPEIK